LPVKPWMPTPGNYSSYMAGQVLHPNGGNVVNG
jgi:hypothetical protein